MLELVILQIELWLFLFLIWDFKLFLVLLGLFANKLSSWRSQKNLKPYFWVSDLVEAGAGQDPGSCMSS